MGEEIRFEMEVEYGEKTTCPKCGFTFRPTKVEPIEYSVRLCLNNILDGKPIKVEVVREKPEHQWEVKVFTSQVLEEAVKSCIDLATSYKAQVWIHGLGPDLKGIAFGEMDWRMRLSTVAQQFYNKLQEYMQTKEYKKSRQV